MTDDHARSATDSDAEADSGSSADGSTASDSPGGGPRRVVSETSVDDILDSIGSEPDGDAADAPVEDEADAEDEISGVSTTFDEDELDEGPPSDANGSEDRDASEETGADDGTDAETAEPEDGELADRIERGAVTGADVRAAEAGDGRDPTPEVDEIDLSLDDLETGSSSVGPSTDRHDEEDDDGNGTDDADAGLIGRLKRLFSG